MNAGFNDRAVKDVAKEMFCKEVGKLNGADGKIEDQLRFTMAEGKG